MLNCNDSVDELALIETESLIGRQARIALHGETVGHITGVFVDGSGRTYRFEWFDPEENCIHIEEMAGYQLDLV